MQRAAASNPTTPSTPASDAAQPPSSKRRKVSNHSTPSTPATPLTEQAAIQAALDAEEAKREEALERIAAERGETKWVLSFVDDGREKAGGLRVSRAGYGDIDGGEVRETGRMKFGKGWKVEVRITTEARQSPRYAMIDDDLLLSQARKLLIHLYVASRSLQMVLHITLPPRPAAKCPMR